MPASFLRETQYILEARLSEGVLEAAFPEFEQRLRRGRPAHESFLKLKSAYLVAKKPFSEGIIGFAEFEKTANRTRGGLFDLVKELTEAGLLPPDEDSPLLQELRKANIAPDKAQEPLFVVNCDRSDAKKMYTKARREKIADPFQLFLIKACPLQMPQSFAERLIREEVKKLESDPDAQVYFKSNGPERVLIQPLSVEPDDADETLAFFKTEFARTHTDFFQKNYTHAAFAFALHEKNWDGSLPEFLLKKLAWLGEHCGKSRRLFACYLVVYIDNFDRLDARTPRQQAICRELETFAQNAANKVTLLSLKLPEAPPPETASPAALLHPVPQDQVERWLHGVARDGIAENCSKILAEFDRHVREKYPDRYLPNGPYAMRDVQELQQLARRAALEQAQS